MSTEKLSDIVREKEASEFDRIFCVRLTNTFIGILSIVPSVAMTEAGKNFVGHSHVWPHCSVL